jgi:signal peptidase II
MIKLSRRVTIGTYMLAVVTLADQISKWWVLEHLSDSRRYMPVTPFLNLVLVWNKGVTFGMMNHGGAQFMPWILIAVAVAILILLGRWLCMTNSTVVAIALGAIMGGAIGNVIDRVRYGAVTDFIDFYYGPWHWYAFNIADAAIVTGVALLLLDGMVRGK